jgi:hypothetical protein
MLVFSVMCRSTCILADTVTDKNKLVAKIAPKNVNANISTSAINIAE